MEKRMKIELRDITAKKKEAQEELNALVSEVDLLREEKKETIGLIEFELGQRDKEIAFKKQELDSIKTNLVDVENKLTKTQKEISDCGLLKTSLQEDCKELKTQIYHLNKTKAEAYIEAINMEAKKASLQEEINTLQSIKHETNWELKFLKGKILFGKSELKAIKEGIVLEQSVWDELKHEKKQHHNHAQYLMEKENFLKEQFGLLGVKYVVYNSR